MVRVHAVAPHSLGAELGLTPGFELLTVNGRALEDFLDWEFHAADDHFVLEARSPEGEPYEFDVERPEGLPLGVELEPPRVRRCANRCDFCFVDGLPEGLRESLYIRDDDYRLSFRYGNFATLTNLKPKDVARITEYRLSPLYVSVHATDPVTRRRLLRNPRAPAIVPQLEEFARHGITFHTQIVLQPGVNDGPMLERSLADLYGLGSCVLSVSVVPVGLTEFSKTHLVREPTAEECREALSRLGRCAERALAERGCRWVYGSDDLYLIAEVELPPATAYDGFEQVENGVGSVRFLQAAVRSARPELPDLQGRTIGIVTGTAMGRLMPQVIDTLAATTGGQFELIVATNSLFGASVTSAGLLPGRDLLASLANRSDLDAALLPAEAAGDRGVFLDDLRWEEVVDRAPVPVFASYDFADALDALRAVP
jgi:putative radical SAM enzyme (TIGR03279 family)